MNKRAQGAVEYLMTYSWALLIIAVVVAIIIYLGILSPSTFVKSECIVPADFNCIQANLYSNGILFINLGQSTPASIQITSIGCNNNRTFANTPSLQIPITLQVGQNTTFQVQCYVGSNKFNGSIGNVYNGYVLMNYTDLSSGFPKTLVATLIEKVV